MYVIENVKQWAEYIPYAIWISSLPCLETS